MVKEARTRGRAPLVVVAEGFMPEHLEVPHSERGLDTFGRPRLGGIADQLGRELEARTGIETRATILGHIQRGVVSSAFDRVLATRLGMAAVGLVVEGRWGTVVTQKGTEVDHVGFEAALSKLKTVPRHRYDEVPSSSDRRFRSVR